MSSTRMQRLEAYLASAGLNVLVLNPGSTLTYLTGLNFHLMERPIVLLFAPPRDPIIILPDLENGKLKHSQIPLHSFTYNDNPASWEEAFRQAVNDLGLKNHTVGVEPTRLRFLELCFLEAVLPLAKFVSAEVPLSKLRLEKDQDEIIAMRMAVKIAQDALTATIPFIKPGLDEREIAAELCTQMLRAGADSEMPFTPIIASGPNSANPHAAPGMRKLQSGDLVVIDWGAMYLGYCSDLTRTLVIGKLDPELKQIYQVVAEANAAGRAVGKPGIPAGDIDRAARAVINAAGYGSNFFHRTGHGLGMESHEQPYMFDGNTQLLSPGMVYTVEPGIYLMDRGGVRIEDDVLVTESGSESLSDFSREMITIE